MSNSKSKITLTSSVSQLRDTILEKMELLTAPIYEPTGLQEEIISYFGSGKYQIIVALHPNDVGKTTVGVNILKNIIWPYNETWFGWWEGKNIFRDREWPTKRFRIASEHTNLAERGAVQIEIGKWWPKDGYKWEKNGLKFPSQCQIINSQWQGDALSYTQDRKQFESVKLDVLWTDEPATPDLIGAMTSRFTKADQMLWLVTATPIKCGPFLDVLGDLKDKGTRVKYLTGTAWENSVTTGKPNHLGTKRGMRTDADIKAKIDTTPLDERDARCYGKANTKAGKIYYDFDRNIHVQDFDLSSDYAKSWNCFMSMDPHPKAYPFIKWWAIAPDGKRIQYNEWPTVDYLDGNYYDEIRNTLACNLDAEMLSKFMKIMDGTQFGLHMMNRFMDPRPAKSTEHQYGKNDSLLMQFSKYGIDFTIPPAQYIDVQRDSIRKDQKYDKQMPISAMNEPLYYIMPHCLNSIRMEERHYWDEDGETESERYKEGPDCDRFFYAGVGKDYQYKKPAGTDTVVKKRIVKLNPLIEQMNKQLLDCSLT